MDLADSGEKKKDLRSIRAPHGSKRVEGEEEGGDKEKNSGSNTHEI